MLSKNLFFARFALIIFGIIIAPQAPLFASFPSGTKVLTPKGLIPIEDLMLLSTPITSLDPETGAIDSTKISCIKLGFEFGLIEITTDKGTVTVGKKQRIYERKRQGFIAAEHLRINDILVSIKYGHCVCLYTEEVGSYSNAYDLFLEKPLAYFLTELRLLGTK